MTEADLKGKKVLVRCDLNVPLDGKTITDDTRIRASIPTVKYLMDKGAKVLLSSHLGRPKDGPEDKFSLGAHACPACHHDGHAAARLRGSRSARSLYGAMRVRGSPALLPHAIC